MVRKKQTTASSSKQILEETTIFPLACERGHDFKPIRVDSSGEIDGYYKRDEDGNSIKGEVYCMLFCSKCGGTKEIVMVRYRREN